MAGPQKSPPHGTPNAAAFERLPPSLAFVLVWLVLPNLAFVSLWITGGPIRTLAIILYLLIGLLARRLPFAVVTVLFLLTVAFDVLFVLSNVFNLSVVSFVYAIEYAWTLRPFDSATYVLFACALLATSAAVLWFARRLKSRFPDASVSVIALSAGAIMVADTGINLTPEYSFGQILSRAAPFDSAVRRSGLIEPTGSDSDRNLLIVMVESWGHLADPEQRALVEAPFASGTVAERYTMTTGVSPYYGSTTAGELRELCGEWGSYRDYIKRAAQGCLPSRLGALGYRTIAFHGFSGAMFERDSWYPNIGFQETRFAKDLWRPGQRICRGVFSGACDTDIAASVARALANGDGQPRFVYWLTLNSHLPVHPDMAAKTLGCDGPHDPFSSKSVCRLAELWIQVFERTAEMIVAPDTPPTNVLIVGDHPPPFWSRDGRSHFTEGQVPWILLRARDESPSP